MTYGLEDIKDEPWRAVEDISRHLAMGQLTLFLGSGVSCSLGLPAWLPLLARILGDENDTSKVASATPEQLSRLVNQVEKKKGADFCQWVHECLYRSVDEEALTQAMLMSPLLQSLVALITGGLRGRVETVVTYNYDNILERRLEILGFKPFVRRRPWDLVSRSDVVVNHVHGYLPTEWKSNLTEQDLVLSGRSYQKRRLSDSPGWGAQVEQLLMQRVALCVGMSGADQSMIDAMKAADGHAKRHEPFVAFWLLTPHSYEENHELVSESGACPVRLDAEEIPVFLRETCEGAVR